MHMQNANPAKRQTNGFTTLQLEEGSEKLTTLIWRISQDMFGFSEGDRPVIHHNRQFPRAFHTGKIKKTIKTRLLPISSTGCCSYFLFLFFSLGQHYWHTKLLFNLFYIPFYLYFPYIFIFPKPELNYSH